MAGCAPEEEAEDEQEEQDKDDSIEHKVEVQADPEDAGEIKGEGAYEEGEKIEVQVEPEYGYEFMAWEVDGEKISEDKNYEFEVKDDKELVAIFDPPLVPNEELRDIIKKELELEGQLTKSDLKELESIDDIVGVNNIEGLQYAENLTELKVYTSKDDFDQLSKLSKLDNLKELKITSDKIEIDTLSPLEEISELEILDFSIIGSLEPASKAKITDLSALTHLQNLKELRLNPYEVKDYDSLTEMKDLQVLTISNVSNEEFSRFDELENLKSLRIDNPLKAQENEAITDLSPISSLTDLEELRLSNNEIKDITPLRDLTNLEILDLSNNKIEDIHPLKKLDNLTEVRLANNDTEKIIENLGEDISGSPGEDEIRFNGYNVNLEDLYLYHPHPYTGYPEKIDNFVWSQDGNYVAYRHYHPDIGTEDIHIINVQGDEEKSFYSVREALIEFAGMSSDENPFRQTIEGTEPYHLYEKHEWSDDGNALLITIEESMDDDSPKEDELKGGVYKFNIAEKEITQVE